MTKPIQSTLKNVLLANDKPVHDLVIQTIMANNLGEMIVENPALIQAISLNNVDLTRTLTAAYQALGRSIIGDEIQKQIIAETAELVTEKPELLETIIVAAIANRQEVIDKQEQQIQALLENNAELLKAQQEQESKAKNQEKEASFFNFIKSIQPTKPTDKKEENPEKEDHILIKELKKLGFDVVDVSDIGGINSEQELDISDIMGMPFDVVNLNIPSDQKQEQVLRTEHPLASKFKNMDSVLFNSLFHAVEQHQTKDTQAKALAKIFSGKADMVGITPKDIEQFIQSITGR